MSAPASLVWMSDRADPDTAPLRANFAAHFGSHLAGLQRGMRVAIFMRHSGNAKGDGVIEQSIRLAASQVGFEPVFFHHNNTHLGASNLRGWWSKFEEFLSNGGLFGGGKFQAIIIPALVSLTQYLDEIDWFIDTVARGYRAVEVLGLRRDGRGFCQLREQGGGAGINVRDYSLEMAKALATRAEVAGLVGPPLHFHALTAQQIADAREHHDKYVACVSPAELALWAGVFQFECLSLATMFDRLHLVLALDAGLVKAMFSSHSSFYAWVKRKLEPSAFFFRVNRRYAFLQADRLEGEIQAQDLSSMRGLRRAAFQEAQRRLA